MKSEQAGPEEVDADAGADGDRSSSDEGARLSDWLVGRLRPSAIEGLAPPPPTEAEASEPPAVPPGERSEEGAIAPRGDGPAEATGAAGADHDEDPLPVVAGLPSTRRRWVILAALVGAIVVALLAWRALSSRPAPARAGSEGTAAPPARVGDDFPRPPPAFDPEPPPGQASSAEAAASRRPGGGEPVRAPADPAGPQGPSVGRFPDLPPQVLKTLETPADDEE